MCGITGTLGIADEALVKAMTDAIAHRGPDDWGVYVDEVGQVALGQRRLSIIDLSAAGHQPMSYGNGRYWITFNGEIYNFLALRSELEHLGYRFISSTDTEVLLAGYVEWGESCLERLRGMFAFAIYDHGVHPDQARLFLARDRFGIKPLYYAEVDGIFLFASELKGLLAGGLISRQVDYQAIWDYLSLGSIPQPRTILADVKALLPGHAAIVNSNKEVKIYRYWDIAEQATKNFPEASYLNRAAASKELRHLLEEATRLHLMADVPVGAFLSGGIDSTAVVGLMSQYVSQPIKTYSIGFESQYDWLSELKWAKMAAERFHTDHTEVIITGDEVAREYDNLIQAIDQPSLDGTNTYFVSKATRKGVTVSLSGLGGDELFAGYRHFRSFKQANQLQALMKFGGNLSRRTLLRVVPQKYSSLKKFFAESSLAWYATIRSLADEEQKRQIISHHFNNAKFHPITKFYEQLVRPELDPISQVSYVELNGYMANTLLRDSDVMSMSHALEVRPVLLDHVLAEFSFALSPQLKLKGRDNKVVMVDALRDILPEPIVKRPKMGFEMPLAEWLRGSLRDRARAALNSSMASKLFNSNFLSESKLHLEQPQGRAVRLWAYVLLMEWLQSHKCDL